jgi:hypothetical protein
VQCPICDDAKIMKKLSAPRLNLSGAKEASPAAPQSVANVKEDAADSVALRAESMADTGKNDVQTTSAEHPLHTLMRHPEFQAAYMQLAKEVLAKTEDVGADFAREARKIHYGESKDRGIRGQASREETLELLDEGIDVMPLPLPKALKGPLQ